MALAVSQFDTESSPPEEVFAELVRLFTSESETGFIDDDAAAKGLALRSAPDGIKGLIENGHVFFVAHDIAARVLGVLEMNQYEVEGAGWYVQMSWLIVDALARGTGVSSELNRAFEAEARRRGDMLKPNWRLQLGVNRNNPALEIYKKWGYEDCGIFDPYTMFMHKDL